MRQTAQALSKLLTAFLVLALAIPGVLWPELACWNEKAAQAVPGKVSVCLGAEGYLPYENWLFEDVGGTNLCGAWLHPQDIPSLDLPMIPYSSPFRVEIGPSPNRTEVSASFYEVYREGKTEPLFRGEEWMAPALAGRYFVILTLGWENGSNRCGMQYLFRLEVPA